jgi:hypothetical protein
MALLPRRAHRQRQNSARLRLDRRQTQFHKEGAYYIEWYIDGKRRRESVGKNANEAFATAECKAQILRNQMLGIEIVGEHKQIATTLAEACREFLEETRQTHWPKT